MFTIYGMLIAGDRLVGFGVRNAPLGETLLTTVTSATFATLTLAGITLAAKKLYLSGKFAQRHVWVFALTHAFSVFVSTIGAVILESALFPGLFPQATFSLDAWAFYVLLMFALTVGLAVRSDYLGNVTKLDEVQIRLSNIPTFGANALIAERSHIIDSTRASIKRLLRDLDSGDAETASKQLYSAANDVIRPMSHKLVRDTTEIVTPQPRVLPSANWIEVLQSESRASILPPIPIAIVATLFASRLSVVDASIPSGSPGATDAPVAVTADWWSLIQALMQLAITFGLFVFIAQSVKALVDATVARVTASAWRWMLHGLSIIAVAGLSQFALINILHIPFVAGFVIPKLTIPLIFAIPVLVAAATVLVFRATTARQREVTAELTESRERLDYETARLNEQLWSQRKGLAKVLHGSLQAALVAGAIQLHNVARDTRQLARTLSGITTKIETVVGAMCEESEKSPDFEREISMIVATWEEVCSVAISFDAESRTRVIEDSTCQAALIDILAEGVSNAVIHGKASKVSVGFRIIDRDQICLTVRDNGETREIRNGGGIGMELYDYVCTNWSLRFKKSGAELTALLPVKRVTPAVPGA